MVNGTRIEKIVVLHTNDVHSHFENMPKISRAFKERTSFHSAATGIAHTLTLDIGDHLDRVRFETEGTDGRANLDIMNATGYEYIIFGNNEGLTFTPDRLEKLYGEHASFGMIGSNIFTESGSRIDWLKPYEIIQKGSIRIGLIGVTVSYNDFYRLLGWQVADPLQTVAELVPMLRPQVDLLIVMSHIGLSMDQQMAQSIDGIDCILGGHTHHLLEQPLRVRDTCICAAGKLGHQIGEMEFLFEVAENVRPQLREMNGRTIPVEGFADDLSILEIWKHVIREGQAKLSEPIAILSESLHNDSIEESALGNLLAVSLRNWVDAELSLVNAGQLLFSLPAGPVSRLTLLQCCPSPINPCKITLTGANIRLALEQSLLDEFKQKPIFGYGFRGKFLGTLCVDGLLIEYDPLAEPYRKIKRISCVGEPLQDERVYTVATIDMFTFGSGYLSLKEFHSKQFFLPEFIRELLADSMNKNTHLQQAAGSRWLSI